MSIFTFSAYSQNLPNALPDTGFVGVGTTSPTCNFQVVGQSQISGNLTVDSSITIADSANVNNNLRVNGHLFVAKNAYIADTTYTHTLRVNRISTMPGDSVIKLGDSTLYVQTYLNTISPSGTGLKGMGIGYGASVGKGLNSVAIGYRVRVEENADYSITIGCGTAGSELKNSIPKSIMLGTNSNLPTLFISPASGINTSGKVGIGTTTPGTNYIDPDQLKLDVHGDARFYKHNNTTNYVRISQDYSNSLIDNFGNGALLINYASGKDVHIANGPVKANLHVGNSAFINNLVCIGTTQIAYGYRLTVQGKIMAEEVRVQYPIFPDYVFAKEYRLMPLNELENYITKHKHLPNIPSAKQIEKDGIGMGELQTKMLEKIEELTLYIIQLQKEIDEMKKAENK